MYKLVIHPFCYSSYRLLKNLLNDGENLGKIKIFSGINPVSSKLFDYHLWSVPWLALKSSPIATDPLSYDEVKTILSGGKPKISDVEKVFVRGVLASGYASSISLLHESFESVLDNVFLQAIFRSRLTGISPSIIREIDLDSLYRESVEKIVKSVSYNFIRETYWASGERKFKKALKNIDASMIGSWLLAKASVGRIGHPLDPFKVKKASRDILLFLKDNKDLVADWIVREQREIRGDSTYISFVRKVFREERKLYKRRLVS